MGDFDNDGDIILDTQETESVIVLNNGTSWNQVPLFDVLETLNGTFADHDNDGSMSLLVPDPQFSDGNPSTIEGEIDSFITPTGLGSPSLSPLTPYSGPRTFRFQMLMAMA